MTRWMVSLVIACAASAGAAAAPPARAAKPVGPPPPTTVAVDAGICALDGGGRVRCFDLADHCVDPTPSEAFASFDQIEGAGCGLTPAGAVRCWGPRTASFAKPPEAVTRAGTGRRPRVVQLSLAKPHGCALFGDGVVQCWGEDYQGTLKAPPGRFVQVAAGHTTNCALREDGAVMCWGSPAAGAVKAPPGPFASLAMGTQAGCAIRPSGELACWGDLLSVKVAGRFKQVAVGMFEACALREDGRAVCFGRGAPRVVGDEKGPHFSEVQVGCGRRLGATNKPGNVVCWRADGSLFEDDHQTRIADADGRCGDAAVPPRLSEVPAPTTPKRPWVDSAMKLVLALDGAELEGARDLVQPGDLPHFVAAYAKLTDWAPKAHLVALIGDQSGPALGPVMRDILDIPDDVSRLSGDDIAWARGVALAYFDKNQDNFGKYFDDRALLKRALTKWRAKLTRP